MRDVHDKTICFVVYKDILRLDGGSHVGHCHIIDCVCVESDVWKESKSLIEYTICANMNWLRDFWYSE